MGRIFVVVLVWLAIGGLLYGAWTLTGGPWLRTRQDAKVAQQRYTALLERSGGRTPVPVANNADPAELDRVSDAMELALSEGLSPVANGQDLRVQLDSFAGYAVLRSSLFRDYLLAMGLQLQLTDDLGDASARLEALRTGKADVAVFTLDALLQEAAKKPTSGIGDPGDLAVLLVLDETIGADAMVAFEEGMPSLQALRTPGARVVLTGNSPSETLARVVIANFDTGGNLGGNSLQRVSGASEVLRELKTASASPTRRREPTAYVLWEPELSFALQEPGVKVLLDSSRFRGFIVDCLVTTRGFLVQRGPQARAAVESYLRSLHAVSSQPNGLRELVIDDTRRATASPSAPSLVLTTEQADRIVQGIWWKNISESAAHLATSSIRNAANGQASGQLPSLDEILGGLATVLSQTDAITSEQLSQGGRRWGIYSAGFVLDDLRSRGFHPGGKSMIGQPWPAVRGSGALPALALEQWSTLRDVGSLQVPSIVFARGSATLTDQGRQAVRAASRMLTAFPQYYLTVRGHARSDGNAAANQRLAEQRAQGVMTELLGLGVLPARVRAVAMLGDEQGAAVTFGLGEKVAEALSDKQDKK